MLEQVKQVLINALNIDEALITSQATLSDDLVLDSLSAVELALELESTFDIRIEDEELAKLKTDQDILDLVANKLS